jgi:hypothetical protein
MLTHWLEPLLPIKKEGDRAKQEDGISGTSAADALCFQGAVGEARWRPYFPL